MLEAKTEEQRNYIALLAKKESCDGKVTVCDDEISYEVDSCFNVDISFDTMAKIVDYLRNENVEVEIPTMRGVDGIVTGMVIDMLDNSKQ